MASLDRPNTPTAAERPSWAPALIAAGIGFVVVALLAALWMGLAQSERGTAGVASVPFQKAPDFTLGLFDGSSFRLTDTLATGKPVVVNFWASWCGPCVDEAPVLEAAWRRDRDRITYVGVNVQDVDTDAQAFIKRFGISYPNGSGNAGPTSVAYGMRGVPETYFIAPDGRIVRKWNGPLNAAGLDQFLGELQRAAAPAGR